MNISNVVTRIKLSLGLMAISTPFENIDEVITTIIDDITLPVFSQYNPVKETVRFNTTELEMIDKTEQYKIFVLPEFKNRNLLYVFDVRYDDACLSGFGYYGGGMPLMTGNIINQTMLANAGASLLNNMMPKLTFHYEHPRKVWIYNMYSSSKLIFELGFEHDKSLASIPETARESFMELALLDVKMNLYPTMKQYSTINTSLGSIDLKIDDWANAESERKDLINRYDDTYHLDFRPMYYI